MQAARVRALLIEEEKRHDMDMTAGACNRCHESIPLGHANELEVGVHRRCSLSGDMDLHLQLCDRCLRETLATIPWKARATAHALLMLGGSELPISANAMEAVELVPGAEVEIRIGDAPWESGWRVLGTLPNGLFALQRRDGLTLVDWRREHIRPVRAASAP